MRKIIAGLEMSVDGFIEGPNGEVDWAMAEDEETWRVVNETLETVDTLILGRSRLALKLRKTSAWRSGVMALYYQPD